MAICRYHLQADLRAEPVGFADLGVQEYWRLDPTGGDYFEPPLPLGRRRSGLEEVLRPGGAARRAPSGRLRPGRLSPARGVRFGLRCP
ncbi:MAG: hypothetical protein OXG52_13170, partial [bacterium]|nr:hypothetical protein [bacterium]